MKSSQRTMIDIFIMLTYIVSSGLYVGAFTGFPKGLDAYQHLGMTKFILNHWPNTRWYPDWYAGTPFYLWYAPLPHYLNALVVELTTWPIEFSLILLSAISISLMTLGLYGVVYYVTKDHDASLIVSLIVSSSPVWGFLIGGGAYARVIAAAFLPLSIWSALMYIQSLKKNRGSKKYYFATVFSITVTVISHMQVGALTSAAALFILVFSVVGWRRKIWHTVRVFVPIASLSAFFLLPFFASSPKQFVGEIHLINSPVPISDIALAYPGNWNTVSPLVVPIGIMGLLILRHRKLRFDSFSLGILKGLGVLIAFLLVYTFTRMPPQIYVFSPYDVPFYLTIFLSVCTGIIIGHIFKDYRLTKKRRTTIAILLASIIIAAAAQLPILHSFVNDTGAQTWASGYYAAQNLVQIDVADVNHRFGSDWDGVSTWFNYWYDVPQTRGFYKLGVVCPDWYDWLEDAVWRQKGNYEETNFLLDWYAVKDFAVAWPDYNYQKFLNDEQTYSVVSKVETPTLYTMYEFEYKYAAPIISATNANTLLVIGEPETYANLFRSFAYSNFNGHYVVPIRGERHVDDYSLKQLRQFDVLVVALYGNYYRDFDSAWNLLLEYVNDGGGLLLDTRSSQQTSIPLPSPVSATANMAFEKTNWNFSIAEHETTNLVNFMLFSPTSTVSISSSEYVRSWADTVLWSHNDSLVVVGEYGNGRVLWTGLNLLQRIKENKNFMESFFLSRMIDWLSKKRGNMSLLAVSQIESLANWFFSLTTPPARGNMTLDGSIRKIGDYSLRLGYNFSDPVRRDEVGFMFNPSGTWNWSNAEFFSVWLYGDGSNNDVTFYLMRTDIRDSFWFKVTLDWTGWRQITYWFDHMDKYGFVDTSSVDKIEITINHEPYVNATSGYIYIDGIYTATRSTISGETEVTSERPNPERVIIDIEDARSGILFKEAYFDRWHVSLIDRDGLERNLDIYKAGPDFMYVQIPDDVVFPLKVVFDYKQTSIEIFAYMLSGATLVLLLLYGIGLPLTKRFTYLFRKRNRRS